MFRRRTGLGWLTAEYGMLPRSTGDRRRRDGRGGMIPGRTTEIQRLIGRSLRTSVDFAQIGERTIIIDCDVLQADGGTRCAAITGGWVALRLAMNHLMNIGEVNRDPIIGQVVAVSCGQYAGSEVLDMDYDEDSEAEVDGNFVMTANQELIEVQCSAEGATFSRSTFDNLLALAQLGAAQLVAIQSQTTQ